MFALGRIILGLVLLFFLVVFSSYFGIITYHIPLSFWVNFHVCQLGDHHLLLCLPNSVVAYSVFLLVVYLIGNLVSITLLSIIMTLDVSIMSYHVFIMIWYHNESLLLPSISPNELIALGTQYLLKI